LTNEQARRYFPEALKLMGIIFSNRGQYNHAALCFAGLLPEPDRSETKGELN
jgi:hypothetical protein